MANPILEKPDAPWLMRTYAGHSSASASNALFRANLAKGQTGLSVAFDLPTQTGLDADDPLAAGEVGKVGVPVGHLGDMDTLFEGLPLDRMNTSMTINATAAWLLALYVALAERRGVKVAALQGTTQNDIAKEYLSRGTYIFPPTASLRLTVDTLTYAVKQIPQWNPINVCSYHLQEAGATPTQELAYALQTAMAVLDAAKASGQLAAADFPALVGRISFFVNAGLRFVEEMCKLRAFTQLWDEITRDRYGVTDAKLRRFRYGVQVNSLGLTEAQPENNLQRIVIEMLGVVLSRDARARAVQLPAWNEALGLPRPWDQQWSLRIQQVMAYETDLLEYADLFEGSTVVASKVGQLIAGAREEMARIEAQGGMAVGLENGYLKRGLVESQAKRLRAIERGELAVIGINRFTTTEPSPLTTGDQPNILTADPDAERRQIESLKAWRAQRNNETARAALVGLKDAAASGANLMPASIACAHAGVTTGEWAGALRQAFGEYRAPTGIDIRSETAVGNKDAIATLRDRAKQTANALGRPIKILIAKPGLDGHSNGAEQIALKAREVGMEVVYEGIRLTPERIAVAALEEGVHLVGLSVLSGSHEAMARRVLEHMKSRGLAKSPVVLGGIVPAADAEALKKLGLAAIYTPKDADLNLILADLINIVRTSQGLPIFGTM